MNKKETFIPLTVLLLSILFALISLAVILTKGKSEKWVARKMRIGALLLTLNAFSSGLAQEIQPSCYDPADVNIVLLENNGSIVVLGKNVEKIINVTIDFRISKYYSYCLRDFKDDVIETGTIDPVDGKYDEWNEKVKIQLNKNLKAGKYLLALYDVPVKRQIPASIIEKLEVYIKEE